MTLSYSFINFQHYEFKFLEAADYIASRLLPNAKFSFEGDKEVANMHFSQVYTWDDYSWDYRKFGCRFRKRIEELRPGSLGKEEKERSKLDEISFESESDDDEKPLW